MDRDAMILEDGSCRMSQDDERMPSCAKIDGRSVMIMRWSHEWVTLLQYREMSHYEDGCSRWVKMAHDEDKVMIPMMGRDTLERWCHHREMLERWYHASQDGWWSCMEEGWLHLVNTGTLSDIVLYRRDRTIVKDALYQGRCSITQMIQGRCHENGMKIAR